MAKVALYQMPKSRASLVGNNQNWSLHSALVLWPRPVQLRPGTLALASVHQAQHTPTGHGVISDGGLDTNSLHHI
jgi:hypothetical protein